MKNVLRSAPLLAAFFVVPTSLSLPAHAEKLVLDPVVVVASRYVQAIAKTPASVTVLDAADLARDAARPLEDILATQAGVTIARTGGPGQQTSIFLRGNEGDSTLVLVDGVKINGGTLGNAALQNLRGGDIERVEIVRGPRSTLHGSEAVGGVISITTKRATDANAAALSVNGGSDNTVEVRAGASLVSGATRLAASLGHYTTDGDPVTTITSIAGAHDNTHATLAASTLAGDTRWSLDAWNAQGRTRYVVPNYSNFPLVSADPAHQDFDTGMIAVGSETPIGDAQTLHARLGFAHDELDQRELNAFSPSLDYAQTRRMIGGLDWQHRTGGNTLIAGIDAERESVHAQSYGTQVDKANDSHAVFARDELRLGMHQFALGARNAVYDSFGEHWTGEASYGLQASDNTFAWLAWGRGFRAPDSSERYGSGGNPALKPETTDSSEIGVRQQFGAHELTATGFVQQIDDLIRAQAGTSVNIARARITGSEFGWSWRGDNTRLELFGTLIDAVDDSTGKRLLRRPEQQLSASAQQRIGTVTLRASLLAMDTRDDFSYTATPVRLPGFAVVDLGVNWQVRPTLTLDARVENIGDIDYALVSDPDLGDYRMPDRAFFIGVEWRR